ncbi:unnamed protein product [Somion occarium]|uniref:Terpene synthase n=1 Tax=Somion occarium TaxID=3059160 RepID=A0ABP1DQ08_9APHY
MSSTKIGNVAPFPPLPGQPYPPARNHPRWKELYRLHDEWLMKYWPFSSEKKRARIPFMNLAGFSTWCAPASDFDRMVWGARIAGIFFLADDYIDSGKMLDRIPGFKKAATGEGPLHPEDRAEICHDIVFRAIKETSHPRTFDQLTRCTHEWWDSNIHEPFRNLDQYLATRRVNIAMYFANSYFRYCLDINLTDEQVNHPLMREAEGIISDHVGLTNDLFSYAKEFMTQSDDTNVIRMLQDFEGLTYEQAKDTVIKKIRQKEQDFIPAGVAVLNDPELGKDPEVHRWIASLPYCMGGNNAWSQESGRYNIGDVPGAPPFPSLSFEVEETPEDEVVDDTEESALRDAVFNVEVIPEPDFTLDIDAIEAKGVRTKTQAALPPSLQLMHISESRAQHVGFHALTMSHRTSEDDSGIVLLTVSSLLGKYEIDSQKIGKVEVLLQNTDITVDPAALVHLLSQSELEVNISQGDSASLLFNAINHIESNTWDGRNVIAVAASHSNVVAMLVGPNAPIVIEPVRGVFTDSHHNKSFPSSYFAALQKSYQSYVKRISATFSKEIDVQEATHAASQFDFMLTDHPEQLAELFRVSPCLSAEDNQLPLHPRDFQKKVVLNGFDKGSIYEGLVCLVDAIPSHELFEKRIAVFSESESTTNSFFCLHTVSDTKRMRDTLKAMGCVRKASGGDGEAEMDVDAHELLAVGSMCQVL